MPSSPSVRVVVCDDHVFVQEGVASVLRDAGLDVVGLASDAEELMRVTEALRPDVVVTDIRMPPTSTDDGLEAALAIRSDWPEIGVVVLSQFFEPEYALTLLRRGTDRVGYILKDRVGDLAVFAEAVRRVPRGGRRFHRRSGPEWREHTRDPGWVRYRPRSVRGRRSDV
jgi:DNA-binding NarL/FixJ family response regulator